MARPRIVRLPNGGEVHFKNVAPAEADRLTGMILGKTEAATQAAAEEEPAKALPLTALSNRFDPVKNSWFTDVLKFDPATGEAEVERSFGAQSQSQAIEQFKILAVDLGIV